jgi:hypothetical protein
LDHLQRASPGNEEGNPEMAPQGIENLRLAPGNEISSAAAAVDGRATLAESGYSQNVVSPKRSAEFSDNPLKSLDMRLGFPSAWLGFPSARLGFPSGWLGFPSVQLGIPSVGLKTASLWASGAAIAPDRLWSRKEEGGSRQVTENGA